MKYTQNELKSCTGHDLNTVQYFPDTGVPRAVLCWHHGLQEHIGRYDSIFTAMADRGVAVFSFDAVGHGKSGGDRAFVDKFSNLTTDFQAVCDAAAATEAFTVTSVPFFIGGHSLGGLIATITCLQNQSHWSGLLLSGPALDVEWTPLLRFQAALGNILAAVVPRAKIVPAAEPEHMNRDPAKIKEYMEDPLNTAGPVAARTANETLKAFRELGKRRSEVHLPIYAHHGSEDKITSFSATK